MFTEFTEYFDLAQVCVYLFWLFFAGLIVYLRREDKREGYPLETSRGGDIETEGWPAKPPPKKERAPHPALAEDGGAGGEESESAPNQREER